VSLLRRILTLGQSGNSAAPSNDVDLVSVRIQRLKPPRLLGIDTHLAAKPWSARRLLGLFREAERYPNEGTFRDARHARHCLSRFWLNAPIDELEILYSSEIGDAQRRLLAGPLPSQDLTRDEREWRDKLASLLLENFNRPERINLILALMPYYAPSAFQVEQAVEQVPEWLLADYASHCDPDIYQQRSRTPAALPNGRSQEPDITNLAPQLWYRRGAEALADFEDADYCARLQALINLYRIDPSDNEVVASLRDLRLCMGQVWLDVNADSIDNLYASSFGQLYQSLLRSGFGNSPLNEQDAELREQLKPLVADLSESGAVNALLAALLFFPPARIQPGGGTEYLPGWLLTLLNSLSGDNPSR
jgi:hypothetical protein